MRAKMNKLVFHATTLAKKSPPGQPHYLQKKNNFLLLVFLLNICNNTPCIGRLPMRGLESLFKQTLQHGLEGCEYTNKQHYPFE